MEFKKGRPVRGGLFHARNTAVQALNGAFTLPSPKLNLNVPRVPL